MQLKYSVLQYSTDRTVESTVDEWTVRVLRHFMHTNSGYIMAEIV